MDRGGLVTALIAHARTLSAALPGQLAFGGVYAQKTYTARLQRVRSALQDGVQWRRLKVLGRELGSTGVASTLGHACAPGPFLSCFLGLGWDRQSE
jgi:hypothetical protein